MNFILLRLVLVMLLCVTGVSFAMGKETVVTFRVHPSKDLTLRSAIEAQCGDGKNRLKGNPRIHPECELDRLFVNVFRGKAIKVGYHYELVELWVATVLPSTTTPSLTNTTIIAPIVAVASDVKDDTKAESSPLSSPPVSVDDSYSTQVSAKYKNSTAVTADLDNNNQLIYGYLVFFLFVIVLAGVCIQRYAPCTKHPSQIKYSTEEKKLRNLKIPSARHYRFNQIPRIYFDGKLRPSDLLKK